MSRFKNFYDNHPKFFSFPAGLLYGVLILFITLVGTDLYTLKIKPWLFSLTPEIVFESGSTTTLEPSYVVKGEKYYYEITFFRISNSGGKATGKDDKLKIQAGGEILGITPKDLDSKLQIDPKDKSIAIFDINGIDPKQVIKGEIHSLSKMFIAISLR